MPKFAQAMQELRDFMFERVYLRPENEVHRDRAIEVIQGLVQHFESHPDQIPR